VQKHQRSSRKSPYFYRGLGAKDTPIHVGIGDLGSSKTINAME